jgi:surface protein
MITNNHVIGNDYNKNKETIKISFNNGKKSMDIKLNSSRNFYTNKEYDVTIIEIKKEDNVDGDSFLKIDEKIYQDNPFDFFAKKSVYIMQYPEYIDACVSFGIINKINADNNEIGHYCTTNKGSSGAPIINLENNKVIGIHKASSEKFNFNLGTFLKNPINEFFSQIKSSINSVTSSISNSNNSRITSSNNSSITSSTKNSINNSYIYNTISYEDYNEDDIKNKNEIKITLNIEKGDVNKEIYFLDNTDQFKIPRDNLKELNPNNTELFINNERLKYQKFFIPLTKGIYEIKLSFQNYIKDCSYMFYNCAKIVNINFKLFKTHQVTNMTNMFCYCKKIKKLDLSSFDTKQVTNMSFMFSKCADLREIILTSFNVQNVVDMSEMFSRCNHLEILDISSFVVSPHSKINSIFGVCRNLNLLKLNKKSSEKFKKEINQGVKVDYI